MGLSLEAHCTRKGSGAYLVNTSQGSPHEWVVLQLWPCNICSANVESMIHCLRDCSHSHEVYLRLKLCQVPTFTTDGAVAAWVRRMARSDESIIFLAGLWWVWRWRNNMAFSDAFFDIQTMVREVSVSYDEFNTFLPSNPGF